MNAGMLEPFFTKGMKDTTEAEVSFAPTQKRFEYIVAKIKERPYPVSSQLSLDISYSKATVKANMSYRITILGQDKIDQANAEGLKFKDQLVFFQHLVKEANARDYVLLEKTRDKTKSGEIGSGGHTLRLSDELKLDHDKVAKLPKNGAKGIYFRMKERTTQVVMDDANDAKGFILKLDSTIVHSGKTLQELNENIKRGEKDYEVEVELMSKKNVKVVPKDVLEAFVDELKYIEGLSRVTIDKSKPSASSQSQSSESSDVATITKDGRATPRKWMLSNRQGFLDWVYTTFDTEAYSKHKDVVAQGEVKLFPHQKVVRDFMQFSSPYRGILLYHGLGTGKTISSIAAAQGFIQNNKKVIVLLPASLETNYRDEIIHNTTQGNPSAKLWSQIAISSAQDMTALHDNLHIHADFVKANGVIVEGEVVKKKTKAKSDSQLHHIWVPSALLDSTTHKFTNVATKQKSYLM